jgi:glycosyltransferase involved in cell wall biosynthesis
MNQKDHSLLDKMNIQTDAIVINQCDRDEIERFEYKGHKILWMSLKERGVGLSRNTALMRATADIVLFADEDVHYEDSYEKKIVEEFEKYPNTDFFVFSVSSYREGEDKQLKKNILPSKRLHWFNVLRYGTYNFAIRRKNIIKVNLMFHLLFGGGTPYSCGEDSIFISEAIKKGLKVRSSSVYLGEVSHSSSTWFKGYTEKYWFDKGVLLKYLFGLWGYPLGMALLVKSYCKTREIGFLKALKNMFKGVRQGI